MFFWIISIILLLLFVTLITRTALKHPAFLSIRAFCTRKHLVTTLFVLIALLMPLLLHNSNVAAQNDSFQTQRISDKKITPKKIGNKNELTLVVNHDSTESWFTTLLFSGKVVSKLTCRCGLWRFDVVIKTGNFA